MRKKPNNQAKACAPDSRSPRFSVFSRFRSSRLSVFSKRKLVVALAIILIILTVLTQLAPQLAHAATNTWSFGGDLSGYDYDGAKINIADSKASLTSPGSVNGANMNLSPKSGVTSDGAAQFTAANKDYLTIADNAGVSATTVLSVGGWVYLDSVGANRPIIVKGTSLTTAASLEYGLYYATTGTNFKFSVSNGSTITTITDTGTAPVISTWYFLRAGLKSDGTLFIQRNNAAEITAAATPNIQDSANALYVGYDGADNMNGRMDSLYVSKTITSAGDATLLYNSGGGAAYSQLSTLGLSTFASNLTSWWDLNEESGTRMDAKGTNHLTSTAVKLIDPAAYGSELVLNPGFETAGGGGADVWANWGETVSDGAIADEVTLVHGGAHAAKITSGALQNTTVPSTFAVTAGQTYYYAFWTRGDGTNAGRYYVYDQTNAAYIVTLVSTGVPGTTYSLVSGSFTTPANCSSVSLVFRVPAANGGIAYFDDVSLKNITYAGLLNGGLDTWTTATDAANWTESISGTSTVNDEQTAPYSGSHAARLDIDASNSSASISQGAGMTIGKKYKYTFYAKADSGTPIMSVVSSVNGSNFTLTTSYVQYTGYFTADVAGITFKRASAASKSLFIDQITLESIGPLSNAGIAGGSAINGSYGAGFNGTSQYLSKTDNESLRTGDFDFEIGSWVYMDNVAIKDIVSKYDAGSNQRSYSLVVTGSKFRLYTSPDGSGLTGSVIADSFGTLAANTWYFVRAYHDAVNNKLGIQVNNGTVDQSDYASGVYAGTGPFEIGQARNQAKFAGRQDSVYFRKAISSSDEITALYNSGKGVKYANAPGTITSDANLKGWWDLDEKSGTRYDSTANDNDLTDNGTVTQVNGVNYYEGAVRQINDLSGNSKNFTQTTQTKRPVYDTLGIGGKPAMQFDGVDDALVKTGDQIGTGNVTITTVIKPRGWGGSTVGRVFVNGTFLILLNSAGHIRVISDGLTYASSTNGSIALSNSYVVSTTRTSAGVTNIYINGALSGTADQSSGTPGGGTDTYIGNQASGDRAFDGWIGPVMTFGSILGDSERNQVEKSLGATYGVTVASSASVASASVYPMLSTKSPFHYTTLQNFTENLGAGSSGTMRYQISNDPTPDDISTSTWYWYNGANWVAADKLNGWQGNTAAEVDANIGTFHFVSPANSLKMRAFFVTDGVDNPILSSIDTTYIADTQAPDLTTLSTAKDSLGGSTDITSGNWGNYANPSFTWNIPADPSTVPGEESSGIAGYLVYWGTDNDANIDSASVIVGQDRVGYRWQNGTTYTSAATLATNSTYYLKVIPVDNAGNAHMTGTPTDYNIFTYKYDNVAPVAPLYTSVTPSGYSQTNHFVFNWPVTPPNGPTDTGGSGLAKFQYRIGTVGAWTDIAGDETTATVTLDDAAALGLNTFNLVAVDSAGNQSNSVRTNFYFNNTAPTAPPNLSVDPITNTENEFAFDWDASAGEIAGYYYSVNAVPTLTNASWTTSTALTVGAYATQQGENLMYVVAKDNAGNYDFSTCSPASVGYNPNLGDTCAAVAFEANTTGPGIPGAVEIYDISVRDTAEYTVAIKYHAPAVAGTGFAGYKIYRSEDNVTYTQVGTTTSTTYLDDNLSSTLYYYYVRAYDNADQTSAPSSIVSITPTGRFTSPCVLVSGPTFTVNPTSIDVAWATDRECSSFVAIYEGGVLVSEQGSTDQVTSHSVRVVGLKSQREYTFQIRSTDIDGNTLVGADQIFNTANNPSVYDLTVDNLTQNSAIINFKSSAIANFILYYGETANYGTKIEEDSNNATESHSLAISGLLPGTMYYFRVVGDDAEGNELRSENSFTTLPMPEIRNFAIEPVKDAPSTTLKVTWDTNVGATTILRYARDADKFDEKSASELVTTHEIVISDLADQHTYTLYAQGMDQFGNVAESDKVTFDTPKDSRAPKISDLVIESSNVGNQSSQAQVAVSWKTDELANSMVEYGFGISGAEYTNKTTTDAALTNHHLVIIGDLEPGRPYHLRVVSSDEAGNEVKSVDNTVITGDVSKSALQLILNVLMNIFGWMGKLIK